MGYNTRKDNIYYANIEIKGYISDIQKICDRATARGNLFLLNRVQYCLDSTLEDLKNDVYRVFIEKEGDE